MKGQMKIKSQKLVKMLLDDLFMEIIGILNRKEDKNIREASQGDNLLVAGSLLREVQDFQRIQENIQNPYKNYIEEEARRLKTKTDFIKLEARMMTEDNLTAVNLKNLKRGNFDPELIRQRIDRNYKIQQQIKQKKRKYHLVLSKEFLAETVIAARSGEGEKNSFHRNSSNFCELTNYFSDFFIEEIFNDCLKELEQVEERLIKEAVELEFGDANENQPEREFV
jgi:hypothetical protein